MLYCGRGYLSDLAGWLADWDLFLPSISRFPSGQVFVGYYYYYFFTLTHSMFCYAMLCYAMLCYIKPYLLRHIDINVDFGGMLNAAAAAAATATSVFFFDVAFFWELDTRIGSCAPSPGAASGGAKKAVNLNPRLVRNR